MKIRRKTSNSQHPDYLLGKERTFIDNVRNKDNAQTQRQFWYILGFAAIILIVLIVVITSAVTSTSTPSTQSISAADTFAISSSEQGDMKDKAQKFAEAMMVLAYSSDPDYATEGKNTALALMASGTDSYQQIEAMEIDQGSVAPENLLPIVTDITLTEGTQSFAGDYTYTLLAGVADTSTADETHEAGYFIDNGYAMELTFDLVPSNSSDNYTWVITNATIQQQS